MPRPLAAFALAAFLLPRVAVAEPAVISRFEAVARAEPSADAAPLQTFVEGTAVTVSEEAQAGWRRVRIADGRIGWIEERSLTFPQRGAAAAPTPPVPAAGPAPLAPDLRPRIYVKDLDHLSELVRRDPAAGPLAERLARRRTAAFTVGGIGLAVGTGLVIYGASQWGKHSDPSDPQFGKQEGTGPFVAGVVTSLASGLATVLIHPKQGDLLDVINTWNASHPDQPFTIGEHHVGR